MKIATLLSALFFCNAVFAEDAKWVKSLATSGGNSNSFYWDQRSAKLVSEELPSKYAEAMLNALAGPPNPIRTEINGSLTVFACVPKSCDEKGLIYLDAVDSKYFGVLASPFFGIKGDVYILGKFETLSRMDKEMIASIYDWIKAQNIDMQQLFFINRCNDVIHLKHWSVENEDMTFIPPNEPASCVNP